MARAGTHLKRLARGQQALCAGRGPCLLAGDIGRFARIVGAAALAAVLLVPAPAFAARSIGISAPDFEFNVAAGQSGHGEVIVTNDGTEPLKVSVYAANQIVNRNGKTVAYEVPRVGTSSFEGPATWLNIRMPADSGSLGNTPYMALAPGQRTPVRFSFSVPRGVPAGDHQIIVFFEMLAPARPAGLTAAVSGRLGARVRIRVQGTLFQKMSVEPFVVRNLVIGDAMPWNFVVRNDGNVDKTVDGKLELLDSNDSTVKSIAVMRSLPLYANTMSEKSGTFLLGVAGVGQYTARLTATYQTEPDAQGRTTSVDMVKQRTVWVFPLWLVIAAVALVGGAALWMTWRQAVWSAERKLARRERERQSQAVPEDD